MNKVYNLQRFVDAQNFIYNIVVDELTKGKKKSHWIWFIFPQFKGLGHSYNSEFYGLDGIEEAKAYLDHPILRQRLEECCRLLLTHKGKHIHNIMGIYIDSVKLKTSMLMFDSICPDSVFKEVLEEFFVDKN